MYDLPGIDEPTPSITYDLTREDGTRAEPVWVNRVLLAALIRITSVDDSVVVLNWQHPACRCRPHRIRDEKPPDEMWPTEIHPDHDYCIRLTEDFRDGTLDIPGSRASASSAKNCSRPEPIWRAATPPCSCPDYAAWHKLLTGRTCGQRDWEVAR